MKTLSEFRDARPLPAKRSPDLQVIAQEAVRLEALSGDPAWDHYNAYLQAALTAAEGRRDQELSKLRDPMMVNDEAIRVTKVRLAEIEMRVGTLKEILYLPKFIKQHGAAAALQIAEMGENSTR
jgi:hypothetical protein